GHLGPDGCPAPDGIPVRRLPAEVVCRHRGPLEPVPLNLLRKAPPPAYRVDTGDVLAVFAEDVLGVRGPVPVTPNPNPTAPTPAAQGYPLTVQGDGTILIPEVPPVQVRGMTLPEVRQAIVKAITVDKKLIVPGKERVTVDLLQPRRVRVLVVRDDAPVPSPEGGFSLLLEGDRNDLLEALTRTGGLPGPGANPVVTVRRGSGPSASWVRVPTRVRPGEVPPITEADITLHDGDTVHVEARGAELYTVVGGAGCGQHPLPPDADLRVLEAVARAGCPAPACGAVVVNRPVGCSRSVPILVDLAEAARDPRENIIVLPGDTIVMSDEAGPVATKSHAAGFRLTGRIGPHRRPVVGCDECE
ncbi:MAG: polysaccharide biosynthesis/export family protein, partial [Gemmataceae bacterium]|nr:polysaccharide biosynthesis/export family protein [Gemmataceae bacterium]